MTDNSKQSYDTPSKPKSYVQYVPGHCDRIVWRGSYYMLPLPSAPSPVETSRCIHDRVVCEPCAQMAIRFHEKTIALAKEISERHTRINKLLYGPGAAPGMILGPMDSDAAHADRGALLSMLTPEQRGAVEPERCIHSALVCEKCAEMAVRKATPETTAYCDGCKKPVSQCQCLHNALKLAGSPEKASEPIDMGGQPMGDPHPLELMKAGQCPVCGEKLGADGHHKADPVCPLI